MAAQATTKLGSYTLELEIGRGGHGRVYRSTHPVLGRPVAIKLLRDEIARDAELRELLLREAQLTLDLNHPGIVNLYEIGQSGEQLYIVMELFAQSLQDAMQRGQLGLDEALAMAADAADALAYAHSRGVIHRDIKPSNVLLRGDGSLAVSDFGLATRPSRSGVAVDGLAFGTPEYMAPEQFDGAATGTYTDVYQFGVMLYELVAGRLPFEGTLQQLMQGHRQLKHEPASFHNPDVPPALDALLVGLLAKNPSNRPTSMAEIAAELRENAKQLGSTGRVFSSLPATGPTVRLPDAASTQPPAVQYGFASPLRRPVQQLVAAPVPPLRPKRGGRARVLGALLLILGLLLPPVWVSIAPLVSPPPPTLWPPSMDQAAATAVAEASPAAPTLTTQLNPLALLDQPPFTAPVTVVEGDERWTIGSVGVYQQDQETSIVGVLRNDGQDARQGITLNILLRDKAGNEIISAGNSYQLRAIVQPGAYTMFYLPDRDAQHPLPPEGEYSLDFVIRSSDALTIPSGEVHNLPVSNTAVTSPENYFTRWSATVSGVDRPSRDPLAWAVFFDEQGRAVGIGYATTESDDKETTLGPGDSIELTGATSKLHNQPYSVAVQITAEPVAAP